MASPWRDQLRPASYKGVPFFIDSHTLTGGRRIVDHVFPYIDKAFTEDLGAKQNVFALEAYVIGEDYFSDRDRLVKAITAEGAGILVHPFLGEKTVEAVDFSLNETSKEGGMARFSLTFHETSRIAAPDIDQDLTEQMKDQADEVDESLIESFSGFDISTFSEKTIGEMIKIVDKGTAQLEKAMNLIPQTDFGISELAYSIRIFKSTTRDLIQAPLKMARYLTDSVNLLSQSVNADRIIPLDDQGRELTGLDAANDFVFRANENRRIFLPLINVADELDPIPGITPSKVKQQNNRRLLNLLLTGTALAEYAVTAASTDYETLDDALIDRDFIVKEVTELMEDPLVTDRTYQAMQDLLTLVVNAIPSPFTQPKRVSTIDLVAGTPSLVLAYDLYEDLTLEQDIVLRNRIANPSLIPSGKVEVISGS